MNITPISHELMLPKCQDSIEWEWI